MFVTGSDDEELSLSHGENDYLTESEVSQEETEEKMVKMIIVEMMVKMII